MIDNIITLLNSNDFYGESELIEIAKGKYKLPKTIKEKSKQRKREKLWLKRQ